jgi:DNA-binding LacI/PurR family transcriptional regulator
VSTPGSRRKTAGAPSRRGTLDELARIVGVSRATVSNAYNRPDQLSADLRERILRAAKTMGYSGPDPAARSLRRGVVASIGVVLTETLSYAFSDAAAIQFLHGLARQSESVGVSLLLIPASPRRDAAAVRDAIVDGFVVYSMPDDDPHVEAVAQRQLPTVFVDQPYRPGSHFVRIDNRGTAQEVAGVALAAGHARLAVVSFPCVSDDYRGPASLARQAAATRQVTRERLAGYRDAVAAHGLRWEDVLVDERPRSDEAEGRAAGLALLASAPRPTAILAMSDQLAFGVIDAARSLGLSVPEDLSVVGFDDIPRAALNDPPLTTVRQELMGKGVAAGELLMAALLGGQAAQPLERSLPTTLVIRSSVMPPGRGR